MSRLFFHLINSCLNYSASEDEASLKQTPRRNRPNRTSFSTKKRTSIESIRTPPLSPSETSDETTPRFSPSSLRPPIFITRNYQRGWGFTFKAIRVYIGNSSKYTVQHIVEVINLFLSLI